MRKGLIMTKTTKDDLMRILLGIFQTVMTAIAIYVANEMKSMSQSINELNVKIATVLEQTISQKERVDRLELRILKLEERK